MAVVKNEVRWSLTEPPPKVRWGTRQRAGIALGSGLAVFAALVALVPLPFAAAAGLLVLALFFGLRAPAPQSRGSLVWSADGLRRERDGASVPLVLWSEPFGVVVLGNRGRTRLLLAFTSPTTTRVLAVRLDERDEASRLALVALAATVAEGDVLEVDDSDLGLSARDARELLSLLEAEHPRALGSLYLSTARDEPLVLEGKALRVGQRHFDLRSTLEWRPFVFHESSGAVTMLYQATWLRQTGDELVFVAPMPLDIVPRTGAGKAGPSELRILAQSCESPPPRELRVAIDRVFMLPLRSVLDRAPHALRSPASATHREGRA